VGSRPTGVIEAGWMLYKYVYWAAAIHQKRQTATVRSAKKAKSWKLLFIGISVTQTPKRIVGGVELVLGIKTRYRYFFLLRHQR